MKKVAIIGSGISGLSAAYALRGEADLTLIEKNDYLGGHAHTHDVRDDAGNPVTLDTGFLVFNEHTYPNYLNMINELGVVYEDSNMSFTLFNQENGFIWGVESLFAQRKNLLSPWFYRWLYRVNRFFRIANKAFPNLDDCMTVEEFASLYRIQDDVLDYFLIPTASAIWSTPVEDIRKFPAKGLFIFMKNHGLLAPNARLQWKTIAKRSRSYVEAILARVKPRVELETSIDEIEIVGDSVHLPLGGRMERFDRVIIATHSDTAAHICRRYPEVQRVLDRFPYTPSVAILHTDASVMPPLKRSWAAWNFVAESIGPGAKTSTVYWLNKLQRLPTDTNFFVSMNPYQAIDPNKVIKRMNYTHPLYMPDGFLSQKMLKGLNIGNKVFFAGAYHKYGFHEDGCASGLDAAQSVINSWKGVRV